MSAIRKTQLHYETDTSALVLGIVTPLPDYRIAWTINEVLGVRLVKQEDIVYRRDHTSVSFSCYKCEQPLLHSVYYLVQNKSEGMLFEQSQKMLDYMLIIQGTYFSDRFNELNAKLQMETHIQATLKLESRSIKNKDLFQL